MRIPAALFYLVLAGFIGLGWYAPHVAASVLAALSGAAMCLMLAAGFHPVFGEFVFMSMSVEPESDRESES